MKLKLEYLRSMLRKLRVFFERELWIGKEKERALRHKIVRGFLRRISLTIEGSIDDQITLKASALTYMTLLSIVPFLAFLFSISKGFGIQKAVLPSLVKSLTVGQTAVMEKIIQYVENTDVKALGTAGLVFLLYTVIKVLANIEKSFNEIWGVRKNRTWGRKFTDYLSVMMIWPFLMIFVTGLNTTLTGFSIVRKMQEIAVISSFVGIALRLIPFVAIWVAFTFLYVFMPNKKIRFFSALPAGIIAGILWLAAQWGYIYFQVGVSKYNAIYGTFASLPIFLVWLYLSWVIVLLGAEIAWADQNVSFKKYQVIRKFMSPREKVENALRVISVITKQYYYGNSPAHIEMISEKLGYTQELTESAVDDLQKIGLLIVTGEDEQQCIPAVNPENLTVVDFILRFSEGHFKKSKTKNDEDQITSQIKDIFHSFEKELKKLEDNKNLKQLALHEFKNMKKKENNSFSVHSDSLDNVQ